MSDLHCGGSTAVCPPTISLDDGGEYRASKAQRWLWDCWLDYWQQVDQARRSRKAELVVIFNGDLVEGLHHGTTQVLSGNPNAQAAVLDACIRVPLSLNPDKLVIVRGTEAHVGQSASAEERIATGLKKDKRPIITDPETGTASWWHFRASIRGVRLDVTHHGRTGQREHTRGGAAVLHAHDVLLSHVKNGDPPPNLCLRAHYHKWNDSYDACPVRVVTTGAWQLGTGFVHRIAADSLADVGGVIVTIDNGAYTVDRIGYKSVRGPVVTI